MPRWTTVLFSPTAAPLSPLSRYTAANGWFYVATGLAFYTMPGVATMLPGMGPFVGHEEGYLRTLGMTVAIIGWFYVMGARINSERMALATVFDRLLVPLFLLPLVFTGQLPAAIGVTFSVLDPLLGLGALVVWGRQGPK